MINILELNNEQLENLEGIFHEAQSQLQYVNDQERFQFFFRKLVSAVKSLPFMKELEMQQPNETMVRNFILNDDRGLTAKVLSKNGGNVNDPIYGQMACPSTLRPKLVQEITKKTVEFIKAARQRWMEFLSPIQQRNRNVQIPRSLNAKYEQILQKRGFKRHEGDFKKCPPMGYIPEPSKIPFYIRAIGKNQFEIKLVPRRSQMVEPHEIQAIAWEKRLRILYEQAREITGEQKKAEEARLLQTVGLFREMQPDFYLKDSGKGTFVELYGVQNAGHDAYELKKKEKELVYAELVKKFNIGYQGLTEGQVAEIYEQEVLGDIVLATKKDTMKINSWYQEKLFFMAVKGANETI